MNNILEIIFILCGVGSSLYIIHTILDFFESGTKYFKKRLYQMEDKNVCDVCYKELKDLSEKSNP